MDLSSSGFDTIWSPSILSMIAIRTQCFLWEISHHQLFLLGHEAPIIVADFDLGLRADNSYGTVREVRALATCNVVLTHLHCTKAESKTIYISVIQECDKEQNNKTTIIYVPLLAWCLVEPSSQEHTDSSDCSPKSTNPTVHQRLVHQCHADCRTWSSTWWQLLHLSFHDGVPWS